MHSGSSPVVLPAHVLDSGSAYPHAGSWAYGMNFKKKTGFWPYSLVYTVRLSCVYCVLPLKTVLLLKTACST